MAYDPDTLIYCLGGFELGDQEAEDATVVGIGKVVITVGIGRVLNVGVSGGIEPVERAFLPKSQC